MKIKAEIVIDAGVDTVWRAFDNPDNLVKWQPTLKSYAHKSGQPGESGATAELVYDENGREIRLTETLTDQRAPVFMAGIYTSPHGKAVIVNHFEPIDDDHTRWVQYSNHTFSGLMKLGSLFFAGKIRKRTEDDQQRFKLFVESAVAE